MSKADVKKVRDTVEAEYRSLAAFQRDFMEFLSKSDNARHFDDYVEKLLSANGSERASGMKLAKNLQKVGDIKGHLLSAVATACREFPHDAEFNVHEVMTRMAASGYEHQAKNPQVAVNTSLKRLMKKKVIERTQEAQGQRPAKYKRMIQRFPRTEGGQKRDLMKIPTVAPYVEN